MEKIIFRFVHNEARRRAAEYCMTSPDGTIAEFKDASRTLEQNAAQWPYLLGFSQQMEWPVDGVMCKLSDEEWKDILTAAFEGETTPRIAKGFDGGVVMLGRRTSKYGKKKFSLWMEWLIAAATLKGIKPVYKNERYPDDKERAF